MGKRSSLDQTIDQKDKNFYVTPYAAVPPLLPFLPPRTNFAAPFAGTGRLINHLERHGHKCTYAADAMPQAEMIIQSDFLFFGSSIPNDDMVIENPPWKRDLLHPIIRKLVYRGAPSWLLFDADWAFTYQAKPFLKHCDLIVAVGRLKWFGDSSDSGKDNCAWYRFVHREVKTEFIGIQ